METLFHSIVETDPASRQGAARLRALIDSEALVGNRVNIDLAAVLSISESYADELFGVLVARYGLEWFARHIVIKSASPAVFRAIADAIRHRLQAQSPDEPDIALLAARKALKARSHSTV